MAYYCIEDLTNIQPFATTDTVQNHPLGMEVRGYDPTYGFGTFIYLKGVASTVVGSGVIWDAAWATTLTTNAAIGLIGWSMSINDAATKYGWYQVAGIAVAKSGTVASGAAIQCIAGGQIDDTTTSTDYIFNAKTVSADGTPSAGLCLVQCSRPFINQVATY